MNKNWVRTGITLERKTLTALSVKAKSMGITRHRLCVEAIKNILSDEKTSEP